ncbi:MAG: chemotaxis protein CheW [Planctomycetes bacterium]|nr:chemotaxis protein CheW [Planctomycetota bacterium]
MEDLVREFLVEAYEGLDQLDRDFVALEQDPGSKEVLGQIFRTVHTIKGASGFLSLHKLGAVAHVGENLLSLLRDGKQAVTAETTSALLAMADAIRDMLEHVEREQSEGDQDYSPLIAALTRLADDGPSPEPSAAVEEARGPATAAEAAAPAVAAVGAEGGRGSVAENSIRVDVNLLDTLMNLVGELVLARNQILQFTASQEDSGFLGTCQRLNLVTTELQEGVMKTRMQQIGSVWTKFPRVVRDLAIGCGKRVRIEMEGRHTELDKTIIESIKDPLLHAIRNAVDHGIETPAVRRERGKPEEGCISLRAFHEGGQVNIEIADDGGGIDPERVRTKALASGIVSSDRAARMSERELIGLVTMPGFSTAEKVTNVSGRGVGMDVVKTNIEKIGGTIDIHSVLGRGTTIRIKIPLTLAIIPALIVTSGGERFAIPQVNLLELVRLDGSQAQACIEHIHGVPVYRLRGNLLPLAYLDVELGHERRGGRPSDREANIVVLRAEDQQFGLVVESVLDTEEIVVKPLGKQLKGVPAFAGAAIMGDGRVALIIDVVGLAQTASLIAERRQAESGRQGGAPAAAGTRETLLLLAVGARTRVAVRLATVARLEEFPTSAIECTAGHEVVQYRGEIMPLVRLADVLSVPAASGEGSDEGLQVVVVRGSGGRSVGLVVDRILDIVEEDIEVTRHSVHPCIRGAATLQGRVTDLLDVDGILDRELAGFAGHLVPAAAGS